MHSFPFDNLLSHKQADSGLNTLRRHIHFWAFDRRGIRIPALYHDSFQYVSPSWGINTYRESFILKSSVLTLPIRPFGAVQLVATMGSAFAATYWKRKSPILAFLCVPPIIGLSIMLSITYNKQNRGVLLFGYYLTSVYPAISPLIYSWSGQNTGGDTKRKVTTGVLFVGASAGNIIG